MRTSTALLVSLQLLLVLSLSLTLKASHEGDAEFCWKDSYGRGVGTIPTYCNNGKIKIGLLCYSPCPSGMKRFGFDCQSVCPTGLNDQGLFCRLSEYGRGGGYPWQFGDALNDSGMIRRCEANNGKGKCEKNGVIYYPKCKPGFHAIGCCICRPAAPNCPILGLNPGIDLSCAKKIKIGDPTSMDCPAGKVKDGGLCYKACNAKFTGVGPVCWGLPPVGWVECGMGAAKDAKTCGSITWDQVSAVGGMALSIATMGSSAAINKATQAGRNVERIAEMKRKFETMQKALNKSDQFKGLVDKAVGMSGDISNSGRTAQGAKTADANKMTEEDIVKMTADIAAIADPTGIAGTVSAYTYSKCMKLQL